MYVYTASPHGLKNSSEVSYERLGNVFGKMVEENHLTRMADASLSWPTRRRSCYEEALISQQRLKNNHLQLDSGGWHVISSLSRSERPNKETNFVN